MRNGTQMIQTASLVAVIVGSIALGGCGAGDSPMIQNDDAVEESVEASINKLAAHPDDWFTYTSCPETRRLCTVELSFNGAPGATLATDHYRVANDHANRIGPANIAAVLLADRAKHCTDRTIATGEVKYMLPCSVGE